MQLHLYERKEFGQRYWTSSRNDVIILHHLIPETNGFFIFKEDLDKLKFLCELHNCELIISKYKNANEKN